DHSYVLRTAESNTGDARDMLQTKLANGLAGLLLVPGMDGDRGTAGDGGLLASVRVRVAAGFLDVLGGLLIRDFFNTGVGHFCDSEESRGIVSWHFHVLWDFTLFLN